MLDLSIIIVNYNTRDLLRNCLRSVLASQGHFRYAVTVVDNASQDDSSAMVGEEFPRVHLLENAQNEGYARANNRGLRRQTAGYYLLLNPDTVLPPDALREMLSVMEARPRLGIAGPKLLLEDGRLDLACRRSFPSPEVSFYRLVGLSRLFPGSRRFGRYNLTYLDPDQEAEVDSVVGAFMLIRGEVLRGIGYLDESFFLYGEDLDLAFRAKAAGWSVLYYPRLAVLHYKRRASRQVQALARREFYRAMYLFYDKHYARTTPRWLHGLVLLGLSLLGGPQLGRDILRSQLSGKEARVWR